MHLNVFVAVNSFAGNPTPPKQYAKLQALCDCNRCMFPLFALQQGDSNKIQSSRKMKRNIGTVLCVHLLLTIPHFCLTPGNAGHMITVLSNKLHYDSPDES